jgi:hypothetical protein
MRRIRLAQISDFHPVSQAGTSLPNGLLAANSRLPVVLTMAAVTGDRKDF